MTAQIEGLIAAEGVHSHQALGLAVAYQLVSPLTHFLLVETRAEADKPADMPDLVKVPSMLPAGFAGLGSLDFCAEPCMAPLSVNEAAEHYGSPAALSVAYLDVDEGSTAQLANIASLPFIHHHVAAMPNVHLGVGATIGSVIATHQAIIPAAVGVDIGCGMVAARLSLAANDIGGASCAVVPRYPRDLVTHVHLQGLGCEYLDVVPMAQE